MSKAFSKDAVEECITDVNLVIINVANGCDAGTRRICCHLRILLVDMFTLLLKTVMPYCSMLDRWYDQPHAKHDPCITVLVILC